MSSIILAVYVLGAMLSLNVANISFIEISDSIKDIRLLNIIKFQSKEYCNVGRCFVCNFVTDTLLFRFENTEFHECLQFGNTHFRCFTSAC